MQIASPMYFCNGSSFKWPSEFANLPEARVAANAKAFEFLARECYHHDELREACKDLASSQEEFEEALSYFSNWHES